MGGVTVAGADVNNDDRSPASGTNGRPSACRTWRSLTGNKKDAGKFLTLNVIGQDGKTRRTVVWQSAFVSS